MIMKKNVPCVANSLRKLITIVIVTASCLILAACNSTGVTQGNPNLQQTQIDPTDDFIIVSGNAAYRQRIAMPPDAVLTVRVEDVSKADAPATVLTETHEAFGERQVPIGFSLKVPDKAIDPRASYAVRASITVGGELRFTTTRSYPVLTHDAPNTVDLLLDAAQSSQASSGPDTAVGFSLPATFTGVMPCADCTGIKQTLTLRADGLYRLNRTYLGKSDGSFAEQGRWTADVSSKRLTLRSGSNTQLFEIKDDNILHLLDRQGQPIESTANLDLRRAAQVEAISEPLHWRGEFTYLADSAMFTDCASGLRWPVAMTADYQALERNYLKSRSAPAAPLLVAFEGRLEMRPAMEGSPSEQIVIDHFGSSQPGVTCAPAAPGKDEVTAELKDTYWKLIELDGKKVITAPTQKREVHITLTNEGSRLFAFGGCNQLAGSYEQKGSDLRFTQMAGTLMACVSPFMELESQVLKMLNTTSGYRIEGQHLILLGGEQELASFEAVYLR